MRSYTRESKIDKWVVKKDNLMKLLALFDKRFSNSEVKTTLTFDQESEEFQNFNEIDKCINEEIIGLKKKLNLIALECSKTELHDFWKHAQLRIDFEHEFVEFNIWARGNDTIKDWADGFNNEMQTLFRSFEPDKKLIDYIVSKDTERYKYRSSTIVFDYENQIEKELTKVEKKESTVNIQDSQLHFGSGDNVGGSKTIDVSKKRWWESSWVQIIFVLGALAGIIGLFFLFYK